MTTQNDGWIKMSERKPELGMNIWAYYPAVKHHAERVILFEDTRGVVLNATHWQPAQLPAPPAKELTQRERDEEAVKALWAEHWGRKDFSMTDFALSCIAYRDKQNAEDLVKMANLIANPFVKSLRRRCGLDS